MDKKSFDMLTQVVDSFRHVGWVNGLSPSQYDSLNEADAYIKQINGCREYKNKHIQLAKSLREQGYTIRQIAATLGYNNPGSISNLLKQ